MASAWVLAMSALMLLGAACQGQVELQGTELNPEPARDFRLTDQLGSQVALSDFAGRPVVLTFLYTNCPDVCPLIAARLRMAVRAMGEDADRVGILAVSTDPVGDDVDAAYRFSQMHDMLVHWHYLVGERAELEPVWADYYVAAREVPVEHEHSRIGSVVHTDALFLIDKQGRMRTLLRSDFDPVELAEDLRALLRER